MAKAVRGIQPKLLAWARMSLGYTEEEVAARLKVDARDVAAWESGIGAPTYTQLEDLAYRIYKRPLAVFFLPEPPPERSLKQEFRTLPDFDLDGLTADTRYQLRLARFYQLSLRELNDEINPAPRKIFRDHALTVTANIPRAAARVREYLEISVVQQGSWKSNEDALSAWRNAVEDTGVFVFKHGFKQQDISGFCLLDTEFPIIYLNNGASKTRQIFSLVHELAHLLLSVNSISKFEDSYVERLPQKERLIEQFCNSFAAEFLVPSHDFAKQITGRDSFDDEAIQDLADLYRVSREVVLRRLLERGMVEPNQYQDRVKQWTNETRGRSSGGNYYSTQTAYLGDHYLRLVFGKHYQGKLNLEQVADYLGVKTRSVAGIEARLLQRVAAE